MPRGKKITSRQKAKIKKQVPGYIRRHQLKTDAGVARAFSICRETLSRIRKEDPEFEKEFQAAKADAAGDRRQTFKRRWELRMIRMKGSPTENIFYLTNHFPDEYKDRRNVIGSINVGAQASASVTMCEEIPDDELITATKAIINRIDKAKK